MDNEDLKILRQFEGSTTRYYFYCPGCKQCHFFDTKIWAFDGNMEKPTVRASILVQGVKDLPDALYDAWMKDNTTPLPEPVKRVCHLFITDGVIEFLSDCTHELAGKKVPMEKF